MPVLSESAECFRWTTFQCEGLISHEYPLPIQQHWCQAHHYLGVPELGGCQLPSPRGIRSILEMSLYFILANAGPRARQPAATRYKTDSVETGSICINNWAHIIKTQLRPLPRCPRSWVISIPFPGNAAQYQGDYQRYVRAASNRSNLSGSASIYGDEIPRTVVPQCCSVVLEPFALRISFAFFLDDY